MADHSSGNCLTTMTKEQYTGLSAVSGARRDVLFMLNLLERPFHIDTWVVLPDHMHCVWTLPPGDDDYSNRWKVIKFRFVRELPRTERRSKMRVAKGESGTGNGGSGSIRSAMKRIMPGTWIMCTGTQDRRLG